MKLSTGIEMPLLSVAFSIRRDPGLDASRTLLTKSIASCPEYENRIVLKCSGSMSGEASDMWG